MDFLVKRLSQKFARGVEKEMLKGTPNKMTGMAAAKNVVTAASATEITLDEVIDLQDPSQMHTRTGQFLSAIAPPEQL